MNHKIDWQAYLDGSLIQQEQLRADELLRQDPSAQAELDSLKNFREQIKKAGLGEAVPTSRLEANLRQIVRENRTPWFARFSFLGPVAAAIVALAVIVNVPTNFRTVDQPSSNQVVASTLDLRLSPFVASMAVHDPQKAAEWTASKVHYPTPVISLASLKGSELEGAECGQCWMAYRVQYQGEKYIIYGRHESDRFAKKKCMMAQGNVHLYEYTDGLAFRGKNDMTYLVKGGTKEGRMAIVKAACEETDNLVASL